MQFIIIAYDGTDEKAMERRLAVREAHLDLFKRMVEKGVFYYGMAILDEKEKMIGSIIVSEFSSREALEEEWLKTEPYVVGKVWEKIEIRPIKIPPFLLEK